MTNLNLDQATKILENIKSEIDEVKALLLSEGDRAPETAPAPSFEAEPKAEGGITSRLLNTFNTIKENVEAVIPTAAPASAPEAPEAPAPEAPEAPAPEALAPEFEAPAPAPVAPADEVTKPSPEEAAPAMPTELPTVPEVAEEAADAAPGSASENALNAILGASAELPSQAQEQAPAPTESTPAPTEGEQPAE